MSYLISFFAVMVFSMLLFAVVIGAIVGGSRLLMMIMEKVNTETQLGLLVAILTYLPLAIVCMIAGPFYALSLAWRSFRSMPWK